MIIDSVDVWVANRLMENQVETKRALEKTVMTQADKLLTLAAD